MRKHLKKLSVVVILILLSQICAPIATYALTGGPSQPEVQSFEPIGTSDMVDVSSGDFNYNIPLLDVGGYPINISYHSGIGMDQEASWVGLGWNINPGVVNRNMRGLPDDFSGEQVVKQFNIQPDVTFGGSFGTNFQYAGLPLPFDLNIGYTLGMYYNNYRGIGFEASINPSISASVKNMGLLNAGLGLSASSQNGATLSPSLGLSETTHNADRNDDITNSLSIGASYNSRTGLKALTFSASSDNKTYSPSKSYKSDYPEGAINGGSSISFANPTYVPNISMPMNNYSVTLSGTIGAELLGGHPNERITGYYTQQSLAQANTSAPAFGYFYSQNSNADPNALLDFNREKDGSFNENTPALPLTNFSYDIYSVSGQGIGGMYKPCRSDVGVVYDNHAENKSVGGSLGLEFGVGDLAHFGLDLNVNISNTKSGVWSDHNDAITDLGFKGYNSAIPVYEPFYFKNVGEKTADPDNFFNEIGGFSPVRVALDDRSMDIPSKRGLSTSTDDGVTYPTYDIARTKRNRRNQEISFLSAIEAKHIGLDTAMKSFTKNNFTSSPTYITRVDNANRHSQHVSEITATREDGARYVYGIPAYNTSQKEVSLNVASDDHTYVGTTGIIQYSAGQNSTGNTEGLDHYYSSTTLPGYAHSYLLTAILSPDYVDLTGNGPSVDDLGSYTYFTYTRLYGGSTPFQWRTPIGTRNANYNEGLKSDRNDDKGNYVYGKKEIWYMHTIESKDYVAQFTLGNRHDALGVTDEDGDLDGGSTPAAPMQYLISISLYSKDNMTIPIKTVHFTYNNELCGGALNNASGDGKLTLKKIYFTYGNSNKAMLSSYQFSYGYNTGTSSTCCNPGYNIKGYDRWGNFKPFSSSFSNSDNPYVAQNSAVVPSSDANFYNADNPSATYADAYASSWQLTRIKLPSGGVINVTYESDDYAYVQDKPAMQMFNIVGTGTDNLAATAAAANNTLFTKPTLLTYQNYNYIFFTLATPISSSLSSTDAKKIIARDYIGDIGTDNFYFRVLTQLDIPTKTNLPNKEYVAGYATLDAGDPYGAVSPSSGNYTLGYIKLAQKIMEDHPADLNPLDVVNPISKAAWQFARLNNPTIAYQQSSISQSGVAEVITALGSMMYSMTQMFNGVNKSLHDNLQGSIIDNGKSFIRLYCPTRYKKGGGSRVKQLVISDKWGALTNPSSSYYDGDNSSSSSDDVGYGQTFTYTTSTTLSDGTIQDISSGVASYEPIIGGDENPFRQPVFFDDAELLAPGNNRYMEQPFGESFFPSPTVVYSKVKTQNFVYDYGSSTASPTNNGYTLNEFYTAKDFPTITSNTGLKPIRKKSDPVLTFLKLDNRDYLTASEGFAIELNDMHGKPKAQWVYAQNNPTALSGTEYQYQTDYSVSQEAGTTPPGSQNKLNNTVQAIDCKGIVTPQQIGVDVDFVSDARESGTESYAVGTQGNLDAFLAFLFPGVIPMIFPDYTCEKTRFRSMGTTKVINRYGLLQKTIAHQDNASVATENLAYDPVSGEVLLTKTFNEYKDPIYNTTYPAHWVYDRMGPACQNIGIQFNNVTVTSNSRVIIPKASQYFVPGDELLLNYGATYVRVWVLYVSGDAITLIDQNGNSLVTSATITGNIKIVRSGRRNQQTTPVFTASSLVSPITGTTTQKIFDSLAMPFANYNILNVSANEFDEHWQTPVGQQTAGTCYCTPSPELTKMMALLNSRSTSLTTSVLLWTSDGSTSNPNYVSILRRNIPVQKNHYWAGSVNSAAHMFTGSIYDGSGGTDNATIQLTFPGTVPAQFTLDTTSIAPIYHYPSTATCTNCPEVTQFFTVSGHDVSTGALITNIMGYVSAFPVYRCKETFSSACGVQLGTAINPYFTGVLGNWRKWKSSAYVVDRRQTNSSGNTNTRVDGSFSAFSPFWTYNNGWNKTADRNWVSASQVTKYSPYGNELEDKDALGNYSSEIFGYNNSFVTAVASNARYNQIGFDNFEDYGFSDGNEGGCANFGHWDFKASSASKDGTISHTGQYSMKVASGTNISLARNISQPADKPGTDVKNLTYYNLTSDEVLGRFSPWVSTDPQNSGRYVLSAWVKETPTTSGGVPATTYNSTVEIDVQPATGSPVPYTATTSGNVIEGWQRIYFDNIVIPVGATSITVKLIAASGISYAYFDDIRIHPFTANMKSYVYDPNTLRLAAILDENNYATIYEYNEEGALARIKKETQNGIFTIQEVRTSKAK